MNDTEEVGDSSDLFCSTDEIMKLIHGLDVSKANGLDGVSTRMLKATASSFAPSLTKLFNLSISAGQFQASWKSAHVVPIPKSSSRACNPSDYLPISLLSVLSKLLEKHFCFLIGEHFYEHHPLSSSQWDFRRESPQY